MGDRRDVADQLSFLNRKTFFLTGNQDLWGMALWLEKNLGARGATYIEEQVTMLSSQETLWAKDVAHSGNAI